MAVPVKETAANITWPTVTGAILSKAYLIKLMP